MITYSTKEAAKILKVKPITVRNFILDNKLKASFIGRTYIITEENLNKFIKDNLLFKF